MSTGIKLFAVATILLVGLVFVALRIIDGSGGRPPPDAAQSPNKLRPAPMRNPEPLPREPAPLPRTAPVGPQATSAALRVDLLDDGSIRLSGQPVQADDLIRSLAFLADEDRDEASWNRVSRRELVVGAPLSVRWDSVRPILHAATHRTVRIYRIFLAKPEGLPVSVSVKPEWVPAENDDRKRRFHIDCLVSVGLRREAGEGATRVELLGLDLGTGAEAVADLTAKCVKIRSSPGNEGLPGELSPGPATPFGEVVEILEAIWSVDQRAIFMPCLMPPYGMWPIGTRGWNLEEEAGRLSGEERVGFLLDQLWSEHDLAIDKAEYLLVEEGAGVLPRLLARMETDGLPIRKHGQIVSCPCGQVDADTALLHSLGPEGVPHLLRATSSRSPQVRAIVVRALGGVEDAEPEVEEAIRRMKELDPDPEVRKQAGEALQILRSAR